MLGMLGWMRNCATYLMISSFSHVPLLRVVKLLRDTDDNAHDVTAISSGLWPFIRAGGRRRAKMAVWC